MLSLVVVVMTACGGAASPSLGEYFAAVEGAAAVYDGSTVEAGSKYSEALDDVIAAFAASGANPADEAALGELAGDAAGHAVVALGSTGMALEHYRGVVAEQRPPDEVRAEHDAFLASLDAAIDAVAPTLVLLADVSSVEDLGPAVAGSPFNDVRPRLERSCSSLQAAGERGGVTANLRCVPTDPENSDAP